MGPHLLQCVFVMGGNPSQPDAGQGKDFGHGGSGNPFFIHIHNGRLPVIGLDEMAVNFIYQKVGIEVSGNPDDFLKDFLGNQSAGGIIGVVEADHFHAAFRQFFQFIHIRKVSIFFFQMHDFHISPQGSGNGVKLLVGRHNGNHLVSRIDERIENMMVSAGSAMGGNDFIGPDGVVQGSNAFLQIRGAFNGTIGEPAGAELIKECVLIGSGQFKKLVQGNRIYAGFGNIVPGACFIGIHPLFYGKGFNVHGYNLL